MPSTCCVPGCTTTGGFPFPDDPVRRQEWIVKVNRLGDKNQLCLLQTLSKRRHYCEESFKLRKDLASAPPNAVPLKMTFDSSLMVESTQRTERAKRRSMQDESGIVIYVYLCYFRMLMGVKKVLLPRSRGRGLLISVVICSCLNVCFAELVPPH